MAEVRNDNQVVDAGQNAQRPLAASLPQPEGPPFRRDDPARMQLTDQERQWAKAIKAAIEAEDEIDPISDFNCAHLALLFKGDAEAAVESALNLQHYREDKEIQDSLSDSRRALAKLVKLFPKLYMAFHFCEEDGKYYLVLDNRQVSLKKMTRTEHFTTFHAGIYYLAQAHHNDFAVIRKGLVVLAECGGYNWTDHLNVRAAQELVGELAWCYPLKFQKVLHYNTGVMFNTFVAMFKKVLPSNMGNAFVVGLELEGGLDSIYLVPTVHAANQRLLQNMDVALKRRYEMEATFLL